MKLLLVFSFFISLYLSSTAMAAGISVQVCIKKLEKVCDYSDFEAALFRCSWRKTKELPSDCNKLFSSAFQYIYYHDRPISKYVCTQFKAPCSYLQTEFESNSLKFKDFLKKNHNITTEQFMDLTQGFKK